MFDAFINLGVVVLTGAALAVGWKVGAKLGDGIVGAGEDAFAKFWPATATPAEPKLAAAA